jgi:hypothetical protein
MGTFANKFVVKNTLLNLEYHVSDEPLCVLFVLII